MKKLFLFSLLALILGSSNCFSQGWDQYYEIKNKISQLGYSIDKDSYAMLAKGEQFYVEKTFYAGWEYILVAFSIDTDVKDVDVSVYETDGSLYKKDVDAEAIALVEINTPITRKMTIYVKNYNSDTPTLESNCRLLIASKRSY